MRKDTAIRLIQIIGTQRSGSNLLRLMLAQSPLVAAPHPPHILRTFMPLRHAYGDLQHPAHLHQLAQDLCDFVASNPVPWNHVPTAEELVAESEGEDLIHLFAAMYRLAARAEGASMACCKSMANVHCASEMEVAGLKPLYIHLFRDGRDVATSFRHTMVGPKHVYAAASQWRKDQEASLALAAQYPDRVCALSYEDLIAHPEALLQKICTFLGIPYTAAMLDFHASEQARSTADAGTMWRNLVRPVQSGNFARFRQELSPEEIAVFEAVAGPTLNRLGYACDTGMDLPLVEEDIRRWLEEDRSLRQLARAAVPQADVERRLPQERLMETILTRHAMKGVQG